MSDEEPTPETTRLDAWAAEIGRTFTDPGSATGGWVGLLIGAAGFPVVLLAMVAKLEVTANRVWGLVITGACLAVVIGRLEYRMWARRKNNGHYPLP